jgi:hypothetical protein
MPALLALVPLKDWIYVGIIVTLLAAFGVYTVHERHIGEAKIEASDKKVADAQIVHNKEVEDVVATKLSAAIKDYDALSPIPVPRAVPVLVCRTSGGSAVPSGKGAVTGGDVAGAGVSVGAEHTDAGFDPAPAISDTGTAADKEIVHLQKKIKLLQDTIAAYQAGGLVAK